MDAGLDKRISDQTIGALRDVIAKELQNHPGALFYAWKIYDETKDRAWLSLSDDEAEEWDSISDGRVTIVAWGYANLG